MERDIVLADEVVGLDRRGGLGGNPPRFPGFRRSLSLGPFYRGGEVADHSVEPDVDTLAFIAIQRNGYAPVQVACDGAGAQPLFQPVHGKTKRVGAPEILALGEPSQQRFLEFGSVQEEMFRRANLQRAVFASTDAAA